MSKSSRFSVAALCLATLIAPLASADELSAYSGAGLFARFCSSCHGSRGEGDGPVAAFFKVNPPDLVRIAARNGGKFPDDKVRAIIDGRAGVAPHGKRAMPVWGLEFLLAEGTTPEGQARAEGHVTRLVDYLRAIQSP